MELEKLVFKPVSVDVIEKEGTAESCKLIREQVGAIAVCDAILQTIWDKFQPRYRKVQEQAFALPTPCDRGRGRQGQAGARRSSSRAGRFAHPGSS